MWIAPVDKPALEEALFNFLLSVRDGRPQQTKPLVVENATLSELLAEPHPDLQEAVRHCLDVLLIELTQDPAQWGKLEVPTTTLAVALAASNCLAMASLPALVDKGKPGGPVVDFTKALIATVPSARERDVALAYHAVLRGIEVVLTDETLAKTGLANSLIERSPLTALWALDVHTPAALKGIAAELLPGWRKMDRPQEKVWQNLDGWLEVVVAFLADTRIARWLRHRWLTMSDARPACRNVGLLLEALRRRGDQRAFILEFYEAYDYFRAEAQPEEWPGHRRVWPILKTIENLLRTPGDSEAAIQVNRRGNEYFLKFLPLVEMIIVEEGVPTDYEHLSLEFAMALHELLPYVSYGARQRISFGEVAFEKKGE